jgi:hypothetical protein
MNRILLTEQSDLLVSIDCSQILMEDDKGSRGLVLKRVPATILDIKNGNGRIYRTTAMESALLEAKSKGLFAEKYLLCSGDDHPSESSFVKPTEASHVVIDAYIENVNGQSILFNDWLIFETDKGRNLKALIQAGAGFGTSIRGLGRQNEKTSEIEDYIYLGTDCVGNPSAGTYASSRKFTVVAESAASNLLQSVKESLGDPTVFDLTKEISQFRENHLKNGTPKNPTQQMIQALVDIELSAHKNGVALGESYAQLRADVYGATPVEESRRDTSGDDLRGEFNKIQRTVAAHESINEELRRSHVEMSSLVESLASEKIAAEKILQEALDKLARQRTALRRAPNLTEAEIKAHNQEVKETLEQVIRASESAITKVQTEARRQITSLETKLETALSIGDAAFKYVKVFQTIAESLENHLRKGTPRPTKSIHSRTLESRARQPKKLTESRSSNRPWI